MTSVTMAAVLASAPGPMPFATAQARSVAAQGFCRSADPLPRLNPEVQPQQQPSNSAIKTTGAAKRDRDVGMASEPPPPPPPPPPPMAPPAPAYVDDDGSAEVMVTGSRIRSPMLESASPVTVIGTEELRSDASDSSTAPGSSADARVAPPSPPRPYPRPQPQSGILTAGEHDDLLNPELYAAYVNRSTNLGQEVQSLPRVDTTRVVTVKVNDRNGQPVPFADVT